MAKINVLYLHNMLSKFSIHHAFLNRNLFHNTYYRPLRKINFLGCQIPQITGRRHYALKLYSQYAPIKESMLNKVMNQIKIKNDMPFKPISMTIFNAFDNENAVKQLQSIVMHSLQPSPNDVIKLLSLYTTCNRSTIHQAFHVKNMSEILMHKLESSIIPMSFDELYQFSTCLRNLLKLGVKGLKSLLRLAFEESLTRAEGSDSLSEAIKYFLISFELYGTSVSREIGFIEFFTVFESHLKSATPAQLAQLIYFAGFSKMMGTTSDFSYDATKSLCKYFEDISFFEAGLVAQAIFNMGLKFDNVSVVSCISDKIMQMISDSSTESNLNLIDAISLVSMVKYLRFTLHKNLDLLKCMKKFLLNLDETSFNCQMVSHLIALYSNCNYYDFETFTLLEGKFFHYLKSPDETIRIKDVSRVMWSLSHAQHQCNPDFLNLVTESLKEFCNTGDIFNYPRHVVDSVLGLSSFNVYSENLFKVILHPNVVESIREKRRSRHLSRLMVVSEVQKTFLPELSLPVPNISQQELPRRTIQQECFHRPCIKNIQDALQWLQEECRTPVFQLKFLISHFHYCSVVLSQNISEDETLASDIGKRVLRNLSALKNSRIAIDVNDENTSLYGGTKAVGLETLKRNLLRMRGWDVKVLNAKDVENCGNDRQALAALVLQTVLNN